MTITVDDAHGLSLVEPAVVRVATRSRAPSWARRYAVQVAMVDVLSLALAAVAAKMLRFGDLDASIRVADTTFNYGFVLLTTVGLWMAVIAVGGGYDPDDLGAGSEEFRRILRAGVHFLALVCVLAFALNANLARGYVVGVVPAGVAFTLVGRDLNRQWLKRQRRQGKAIRRVLAVGSVSSVRDLAGHFQRSRWAGYAVVGACSADINGAEISVGTTRIPMVGGTDDILVALRQVEADVVAVASDTALAPGRLRSLAWELEGTGIELAVVPAVTDLAGPRIAIRPVSGLPLLHMEEPRFKGPARVLKECTDRLTSAVALLAASPVLLVVAVLVKVTSPGPVMFRQIRVGRGGRHFTVLKFRTMFDGAHGTIDDLKRLNDHDGPLFKMREDPRVTRVGRMLRRFSLDELPQLVNVVKGDMSLVGPRPPLPSEVEVFSHDVRRRLLVKPGITGLWQVSGRSDLPWEEAVRLDLFYVENWSPTLDFAILIRTVHAVVQGRGAY